MQRQLSAGQLRSARAVLLLEVLWAGSTYRFASEAVSLTNVDGATLNYGGGLNVQQIGQQLDRGTISADDLSVPLEVVFPIDAVLRVRRGNPLSAATGELSVVMVRGTVGNTTALQDWEDRAVLLRGSVSEAIIGAPGFSPRRVAFSLESAPVDVVLPILDERTRISNSRDTEADGKMPPLVFGRPGVYTDADGTERTVPGSPTYEVTGKDGSAGNLRSGVLTIGKATATEITLTDNTGTERVRTTEFAVASPGYQTRFEELLGATYFDNLPIWISWTEEDTGGIENPYGPGILTGLGDLSRFLLSRASGEVDHGAWAAAAQWLNRYLMAGYINEATTTVWDWYSQHILPIVPSLSIVRDIDGLIPILYGTDRPVESLSSVTTGPGFILASGETETRTPSEVYNDITLEYAYDASAEQPKRALRIGPDGVEGVDIVSPTATASSRIYGHRIGKTIQSWYVYREDTARRILSDYVTWQGFIGSEVSIDAAPEWGWLTLGKEIALTSDELSLTARRAVVVSRAWQVLTGRWAFTLWISPDPLSDPPEL